MLNLEKSGLHLLRISVLVFLSLECVFSFSLLPRHAPFPPSIPSLSTLMQALERTRARIAKEQLDRTQKHRQKELLAQERRETFLVRQRTKKLSERTLSLSHSLFEARKETFILRERTDRLSRCYCFLSCLCFLLCLCLAFFLVFHFVDLCDKRWLPKKSNGN